MSIEFTDKQVALIKRTICKPKHREATNDELALFIGQCKRTGLDPFARQIYAVFRKDKQGHEEMGIQVSIDGQRAVAERGGQYAGQDGPFWCGPDGIWTDVWLKPDFPAAAKVVVIKIVDGNIIKTPAIALWSEYAVYYGANLSLQWKDKPSLMLAKCAEALALRKAFPNDLSGLYAAEEMGRADTLPQVVTGRDVPMLPEGRTEPILADPVTGEVVEAQAATAVESPRSEPEVPIASSDLPDPKPYDPADDKEVSDRIAEEVFPPIPSYRLDQTGMNPRAVRVLERAGIVTLDDLRARSWPSLEELSGFGPGCRAEVEKLAEFYEFVVPEGVKAPPAHPGEQNPLWRLQQRVRTYWLEAGASEEQVAVKLRQAGENLTVLEALVEAARAQIAQQSREVSK